ncbi:MAG: alpha/beta hydrolase family protein [Acidimicrobiia bacterium]
MTVNGEFMSDGLAIRRYLALPSGVHGHGVRLPGLILCHGFPVGPIDARHSAGTFPELMDRVANEMGFAAMTFTFRGCGESEGDFSLEGWMRDMRAAVDHLVSEADPSGVWLAGTATGGSLCIVHAADDPRISGVAALAARADFDDWAGQPRKFLDHARDIGAVRSPSFPKNFDQWARELRRFRPLDAARRLAPRPLLVVHGGDDDSVPVSDARQLTLAHGSAELRIIAGAGHRLRHDPRAVAVLLGWLDRQRNRAVAT